MAQKRISDLELRSDFDETCLVPVDDAVQSWRTTGAQILAFMEANLTKNGVQTRILGSQVTSNGSISGLAFTSLTIGKIYRVTLQATLAVNQGGSDPGVAVQITHDGAIKANSGLTLAGGNASDARITCQAVFLASATSVTFVANGASANSLIDGDGTLNVTFATVEELNDYEIVTDLD